MRDYYYKDGNGYRCVICKLLFVSAFAKQDAKRCCRDHKPLSKKTLRDAEAILASTYPPVPMPRLDKPAGDALVRRDQWRHYRRGKVIVFGSLSPLQQTANYYRAQQRSKRTMDMIRINKLIPVYGDAVAHAFGDDKAWRKMLTRKRRGSRRQRAAYRALNPHPYAGGGHIIAARIAVARVDDRREVELLDNNAHIVRSWL